MRALYGPYEQQKKKLLLPITSGGTSGDTAAEAASNIGLLTRDMIGQPNGLVAIDPSGNVIGTSIITSGNLIGETTTVDINESITFTISDYDARTNYTLNGINGNATRVKDVITFTAGGITGRGAMIFNGRKININITGKGGISYIVNKPVVQQIALGTARAYNVFAGSVFGVTASDGSDASGFELTSSTWTLKTNTGGLIEQVTKEAGIDEDLDVWTNTIPLNINTTYKVQVEYFSVGANSSQSVEMVFSTKPQFKHEVDHSWSGLSEDVSFGYKSVVSENGNILVISEPDMVVDYVNVGVVYIYERTKSGMWSNDPVKYYTGTTPKFGMTLDISDDGQTLMVGDDENVYIYKRINGKWSITPVKTVSSIYYIPSDWNPIITSLLNASDATKLTKVDSNIHMLRLMHGTYTNVPDHYKTVYSTDGVNYYVLGLTHRLNDCIDNDGSHAFIAYEFTEHVLLRLLFSKALAARTTDLGALLTHADTDPTSDKMSFKSNDPTNAQHYYVVDNLNAKYILPYDILAGQCVNNTSYVKILPYGMNTSPITIDLDLQLQRNYDIISPDGTKGLKWELMAGTSKYKLVLYKTSDDSVISDISFDVPGQNSPLDVVTGNTPENQFGAYIVFSKNARYMGISSTSVSANQINIYDTTTLPISVKYIVKDFSELLDVSKDDTTMVVRDHNAVKLLMK